MTAGHWDRGARPCRLCSRCLSVYGVSGCVLVAAVGRVSCVRPTPADPVFDSSNPDHRRAGLIDVGPLHQNSTHIYACVRTEDYVNNEKKSI